MPGRSFSTGAYKYGFNGKEKDDEVKGSGNSLDFGARVFDSRLGRWLSLDPLMHKYASLSPYHFGAGNPIINIDGDGKDFIIFTERNTFTNYVTTFQGQDKSMGYNARTSNFSYTVIKAPGKDRFFYNTIKISDQVHNGRLLSSHQQSTIKEFFPNDPSRWSQAGRSGITSSSNGLFSINDDDYTALAKLSPTALRKYLENRDWQRWRMLSHTNLEAKITEKGAITIGLLSSMVEFGPTFLRSIANAGTKVEGWCFPAGVKVMTNRGEVNIQDITTMDSVITYNIKTHQNEPKGVTKLFERTVTRLAEIGFKQETLLATESHQFYVNHKWLEAAKIKVGDTLSTFNQLPIIVVSVRTVDTSPTKIFNFEVEGNHNYFVSNSGVLVHNTCSFLFKKASDFKLVHPESTIVNSSEYGKIKSLSDEDLIKSVTSPSEGDFVRANENGTALDGNTRLYEIQRRGLDVDVPYLEQNSGNSEIFNDNYPPR